MKDAQREHFWDFTRAFYLLLGIPFHAAVTYSLHHDWAIPSPVRDPLMSAVADTLHTFRMPGFFVIAGYFSLMLLMRQEARDWAMSRLVRLGLPLLTATLTILPVQMLIQVWFESLTGSLPAGAFWTTFIARLTRFDEPWISHLWFLYSLLAFSAALAFGAAVIGQARFVRWYRQAFEFAFAHRWLSLAGLALISVGCAVVLPLVYALGGDKMPALIGYIQYFPFFFLGAALFASPVLKARYTGLGAAALIGGAVLLVVAMATPARIWAHGVVILAGLIGAVLITGFIAAMARRYCDRPSLRVRQLADASFSIYLFHHPIIMALATVFALTDWPPVAEFLIVVPVAAIASYGCHLLVASNRVTALLYNGIRMKRATDGPRLPVAGVLVSPER
ncbi:acyltransferase family protein [Pseudohoeflea coraliihabitans]|uniref:Acyltransferase family protein n=1 Tax=Pseudohoeflea coraliihabitans TaxID=2860393 RepID=A0ABS6WLB6_9HYPH|nr:acyltransferase family protein [Pseudohoeflea sp. DP4N28-3]MBW3095864.1 acyltransferase family protein [Pseudohoeflea sp. DP4N28-3]